MPPPIVALRSSDDLLGLLADIADDPDRADWALLVDSCGRPMYRIAYGILGDHHLAEDAVQQALLAIRESAPAFSSTGRQEAARAWIYRVTAHNAMNLRRHHRATIRREVEHSRRQSEEVHQPDEVARDDTRAYIRRAIGALPEQHQQPLLMHYFGDMPYEEMAEALECTVTTARVKVHRALKRLRRQLGRIGWAASLGLLVHEIQAAADAIPQTALELAEPAGCAVGTPLVPVAASAGSSTPLWLGTAALTIALLGGGLIHAFAPDDQPVPGALVADPAVADLAPPSWDGVRFHDPATGRLATDLARRIDASWRLDRSAADLTQLLAGHQVVLTTGAMRSGSSGGGLLLARHLPVGTALDIVARAHGLSGRPLTDRSGMARGMLFVGPCRPGDRGLRTGTEHGRAVSQAPPAVQRVLARPLPAQQAVTVAERLAAVHQSTGLAIACLDRRAFELPVAGQAGTARQVLEACAAAGDWQLRYHLGVVLLEPRGPDRLADASEPAGDWVVRSHWRLPTQPVGP